MLDDIVEQSHKDLKLNKINDELYLTNKEVEVLERYNICYNTTVNLLMYEIDEILNNSPLELTDLEDVSKSIAEFNYYHNTNK